ncbi:MAG: hypothetical protein UT54_C0003G0013 [Candidatus Daviesbacteria bacterium GW2011_GWB1_39_5]|uniref:Uncharacterized protein n=1 Tax=Candidatus Daviesbacteria bacterium GW2011_GWC2_40_12 TaxID=1618431 RepID=A0A0G0QQY0_9BACT|nr:MAG: hypothetical protein UT04_C0037G0004 [Candidatus Daviesbacteria bacterium GW2011_GWF2_38_7]KKR17467.1 MAG: hypothetical protein UT45_C0001G0142 [Candidatus Daviesbacteria bacterium GW2011_GWA2_39_33]KKR25395.1 MAG: hypothetical protein UT54_C0003G0013 [Candidatus Daviesbacteria bacterium GW2011_GWB1_39_5]KKR42844.1 MAG: hypothetical protein UT77_C0001G0295 [Candidatus Daviesbacteria bacterium GW2011_GWC2_40_12]OGE21577.1 MAG: hypothetical protein A2778_05320 [Candidatus Daviesbacteria b
MKLKNKYTDDQIKSYLINRIKQSIINDVGGAFEGWSSQIDQTGGAGFYAIPRMLFPEIDGLGSYITGNPHSTGLNIKTYLSEVMGIKRSRYKEVAAFMVFVYRHGLLHQHEPKCFSYKKKVIGLQFTIGNQNNPQEVQAGNHLVFIDNVLMLDANTFYYDVVNSIDDFANDIITKYKKTFEASIKIQSKPLTKTELLFKRTNKYISEKDFDFLKTI